MNDRAYSFLGGEEGPWEVIRISPVVGDCLPEVPRLLVTDGLRAGHNSTWVLRGVTSNERYTTRSEKTVDVAVRDSKGRAGT
jgi:hypothetical protein